MNITSEELLELLGAKEVELYLFRKRVALLEQDGQRQIAEFAERLAALETAKTSPDS